MKKKILFRIGSLYGGGAEKSLITLLKYFDYSKYEVDLLLNSKTGIYLNRLPKEVHLYYIGNGNEFLSKIFFIRFLQKVWRRIRYEFFRIFPCFLYRVLLKNKKYDIEIGYLHDIIPQLVKSPLSSKKIGWIHANLKANYYDNMRKNMLRSLEKLNRIVAVSEQSKEVLFSLSPDLNDKTSVIYNPIEKEEVIRKSFETDVEKSSVKLKLIAIGRLDILQKSFDRLINVCHKLKQENFVFELQVLGEGTDQKKLVEQVKTLQLEDTIKFLGYRKNPYPYISAADIFVMSSRYEALPYVVLEALILNKPIVSTDITGSRELLKDGELGLLVENSEEGLLQGLKKMISDNSLREYFTNKKKDFSAFEPKFISRQVEEVIENLCKNV